MTGLRELLELDEGLEPLELEDIPLFRFPHLNLRPKIRKRLPRPRLRISRPSHDRVADLCFLAGLAAFAGGCGWIFPPAAPIVGGAFLAAVAWIEQRGRAAAEDEPAPRTVERWFSDEDDEEDLR